MSPEKKVVLVTGAVRGIGKGILIKLAGPDTIVIGTDRSSEAANEISQFLQESDIQGEGLVMDVNEIASIQEAVGRIEKKYGTIAILVNNAGIARDNLLIRMTREEWTQVVATNLTAVFDVSQACLRGMLKNRWGRIINIASVVGYMGNVGQANYAATKAGVIGFSKSLAMEVASRNITVNCIAPGFIETAMTEKLTAEQREKLLSMIPMKKIGSINDVAMAAEFLAGDGAAYITGTTIHVNGGMFML